MAEITWSEIWSFISEPRHVWIGLLAGWCLVTILFVVMLRTRWGQVEPLSKCIWLSVLAHLLLLGYAQQTVFPQAMGPGEEPSVAVQLTDTEWIEPFDEHVPEETELPDADEPPWERLPTETSAEPESIDLHRQSQDREEPRDRETEVAPVEAVAALPEVSVRPVDLADSALPSTTVAMRPARQAAEAAPIEPLEPQREETAAEAGPVLPETPTVARTAPPIAGPSGDLEPVALPTHPRLAPQRLAAAADFLDPASLVRGPDQLEPMQPALPRKRTADRSWQSVDPLAPAAVAARRPATVAGEPLRERHVGGSTLRVRRRQASGAAIPPPLEARVAENREQIVHELGGSRETEAAVQSALNWLVARQSEDGRWDADQLDAGNGRGQDGQTRDRAGALSDTGITGLSLLALMANGNTHLEGPHREHVQHGLEFLLRSQAANGSLAGQARLYAAMYCHGMATLAISEAYALSGDSRLKPFVEKAVGYTVAAQHPSQGGWRYQPGDLGDMSQFGWQLMALKSAEMAGVPIPERTRAGMERFLASVSSGRHGGLGSYRPGEATNATMTAEALVCRFFLGARRNDPAVREAAEAILREPPSRGKLNLYYLYYGTLAMYQVQGDGWEQWNAAMQRRLLETQRSAGTNAGSWDPNTVWGGHGGRGYTTALAALCLQSYYRYLPLHTAAP